MLHEVPAPLNIERKKNGISFKINHRKSIYNTTFVLNHKLDY